MQLDEIDSFIKNDNFPQIIDVIIKIYSFCIVIEVATAYSQVIVSNHKRLFPLKKEQFIAEK